MREEDKITTRGNITLGKGKEGRTEMGKNDRENMQGKEREGKKDRNR